MMCDLSWTGFHGLVRDFALTAGKTLHNSEKKRRKEGVALTAAVLVFIAAGVWLLDHRKGYAMEKPLGEKVVALPQPVFKPGISLEEALSSRRSVRRFDDTAVTLEQLATLMWAAQGVTGSRGFRAAPSAGALYPLEIYAVTAGSSELPAGIYRYRPRRHALKCVRTGDFRGRLGRAALGQASVMTAPLSFLITAVFDRTTVKYGERGVRYVFMEAGHAAQNVLLAAGSLGLGAVPVGAFDDKAIEGILGNERGEAPLYIIPAGYARE